MNEFNLKKKKTSKKKYSRKENILLQSGNELINNKLQFIKKNFFSCLFYDQSIDIKVKEINKFFNYNLKEIDKRDEIYDGIFANFSTQIEFANNLDDCLTSIYKKLIKDGLFCFNLLTPNSMKTLSKIFIEIDESIFDGAYNRFGPFHDVSVIIEGLNKNKFKEIVVGTELIEINYKSFNKLRTDFKDFGLSNSIRVTPKFKREFLSKTLSVFSKIIDKYNYIPVEFEIATFTSWK